MIFFSFIFSGIESMNSFMQGAIQQMKHDYDPIYQTGSKFVNLNTGTKDESNKIQEQNPNIRTSPWINMGNFEANTFGGVMMGGVESVSQTGHYLEPDFKGEAESNPTIIMKHNFTANIMLK